MVVKIIYFYQRYCICRMYVILAKIDLPEQQFMTRETMGYIKQLKLIEETETRRRVDLL